MTKLGKNLARGYKGISVDNFNATYPVGTKIKYYPIVSQSKFDTGITVTPAWALGHGLPVVTTNIIGGGLSFANIEIA